MQRIPRDLEPAGGWRLEGPLSSGRPSVLFVVERLPLVVGRLPASDLTLPEPSVSGRHARLVSSGGSLAIEDLGSTNGTFVNGQLLTTVRTLSNGDVVQFGNTEFRIVADPRQAPAGSGKTQFLTLASMHGAVAVRRMRELLDGGMVRSVYQSVVRLGDGAVVGYEALGRGCHPELGEAPAALLHLAKTAGMVVELSRLLRDCAVDTLRTAGSGEWRLLVNAHPEELAAGNLVESMVKKRRGLDVGQQLVLELHEGAILDPAGLRELRDRLAANGIQIAYDDFGAGQTRLAELGTCPPDYIKFARPLIGGLDRAGWERRHVLKSMVAMATDLGCATLAEGVETEAELDVCRELGFELAQGYLFDRPAPIEALCGGATAVHAGNAPPVRSHPPCVHGG